MRKFYKNLAVIIFTALVLNQGAYCADSAIIEPSETRGVNVSEFKKVKNIKSIFKKKNKEK